MASKYIFVTGGVVSSLGKGIAASSLGCLLESRGFKIFMKKFDPYINVDPGTMSPYQHGEVFVTDDGAETDLDLGNYERFTGFTTDKASNYTTGRIYSSVIARERRGDYLGQTVQVVPHITDEIKKAIREHPHDVDVVVCEIGGTVGDIESLPFLEAIRQFRQEEGIHNAMFVHVTLVPYIAAAGELKTKPTQHSVKELRSIGIQPDILLCRSEKVIPKEMRAKISLFTDVQEDAIVTAPDVKNIYRIPLNFAEQGLDYTVLRYLGLPLSERNMASWTEMADRVDQLADQVTVAFVGKYVKLEDSYKSLIEALRHGGLANGVKVNIRWVDAESIENEGAAKLLQGCDAVLLGPGFGERGTEGKIQAITHARENNIPFLGICLGMQLACVEFARNVVGIKDATSEEFEENAENQILYMLRHLVGVEEMGGNMRLGAYPCVLDENTKAHEAYGVTDISERHRHRFEFNKDYLEPLKEKGMVFSGMSPDGRFVEIVELPDHPWMVGCQFHPEYKSRILKPHPLFIPYLAAAKTYHQTQAASSQAKAKV